MFGHFFHLLQLKYDYYIFTIPIKTYPVSQRYNNISVNLLVIYRVHLVFTGGFLVNFSLFCYSVCHTSHNISVVTKKLHYQNSFTQVNCVSL